MTRVEARNRRTTWLAIGLASCLGACSGAAESDPGATPSDPSTPVIPSTPANPATPATPVTPSSPASFEAQREEIIAELGATARMTPPELIARYPAPVLSELPYSGVQAQNLDIIQASALGLNAQELAKLGDNGLVISARQQYPSFVYGYEAIYGADLPLYVSADSILHAVHRSYDKILTELEIVSLIPELTLFLEALRDNLAQGHAAALHPTVQADVDLYLAVAISALKNDLQPPVRGADANQIRNLFTKVMAAEGVEQLELFGAPRRLDFSQYKPRGHYTATEELQRYFRAMMWLGRIDFRLVETKEDLSQVFHRQQFDGAVAFHAITDADALDRWTRIDRAIGAFVGEHDSMTLPDVRALMSDLELSGLDDLARMTDAQLAEVITKGGYGVQRISSHYMVNGVGEGTMPLNYSFTVMGQRYVLDSHVFSNLVYDRVQRGDVRRMMPKSLDVAFAALGNNQAADLLQEELQTFQYAPDLHAMRYLADGHDAAYWQSNLYNLWMSALRALSPDPAELADPAAHGLPRIATTEAFGRRILNTQLASWAELRHNTLLYAKQSYSAGVTCEFPDAYVDPYPDFYAAIAQLAQYGQGLVSELDWGQATWVQTRVMDYFVNLYEVASMLQEMAEYQRQGLPFSDTHMAFINETVRIHMGCGAPAGAEGWYPRLFFDEFQAVEFDPTIADVHTQPTDEVGTQVGRVLHVATGMPRLMVLTVETCNGVRAYAGLVSAYHERITRDFLRLDDETWAAELQSTTQPDVPWMTDLVVH